MSESAEERARQIGYLSYPSCPDHPMNGILVCNKCAERERDAEIRAAVNDALERAAQRCDDWILCEEDERYDNEESEQIGEGTVHNRACYYLAAAIRELKDE